jgi:dihydroceramidase
VATTDQRGQGRATTLAPASRAMAAAPWWVRLAAVLVTGDELTTPGALGTTTPGVVAPRHWGAATGINWCEEDYALTPHIAEFWNTVSNLVFLVVGLGQIWLASAHRLPARFWAMGTSVVMTGLASAAFHATLWRGAQRADEACENTIVAILWHAAERDEVGGGAGRGLAVDLRCLMHALAASLGVFCVTAFLFAEVHLIGMATACAVKLWRQSQRLPAMRAPLARGLFLTIAGAACWVVDRLGCDTVVAAASPLIGNPQLHAWWHVLIGLAIHQAFVLAAAIHLVAKGGGGDGSCDCRVSAGETNHRELPTLRYSVLPLVWLPPPPPQSLTEEPKSR